MTSKTVRINGHEVAVVAEYRLYGLDQASTAELLEVLEKAVTAGSSTKLKDC